MSLARIDRGGISSIAGALAPWGGIDCVGLARIDRGGISGIAGADGVVLPRDGGAPA